MKSEQATGDRRPATGDSGRNQQETGDRRPATGDSGEMRLGRDIAERLLGLAASVIGLARERSNDQVTRHIMSQLVRSCSSGGANYEEARAAESRPDFIHKVGLSAKEMRETQYWLKLLARTSGTEVTSYLEEARQLSAILAASSRTARERLGRPL